MSPFFAFVLISLLIVSNVIWWLIYKAMKKMIDTYRNIIMSQSDFKEEVLRRMDGMRDSW